MRRWCFLCAVVFVLLLCGCGKPSTGSVAFRILDGHTAEPVQNAAVVIPEADKTVFTDANGYTEDIEVTIVEDTRFAIAKPWGEVSVLIYKDGFSDYALFYAQVQKNVRRDVITVFLYNMGAQPYALIEGPKDDWVLQMLEHYRPDDVR